MKQQSILVIGNGVVVSNVCFDVAGSYNVNSYMFLQNQGKTQNVDWSPVAMTKVVQDHGQDYAAVIVDLLEKESIPVIKSAGYEGAVVGLVSSIYDEMEGADHIIVTDITKDHQITECLDGLLK